MDGQSWTGDWKAATFYKIGELLLLSKEIRYIYTKRNFNRISKSFANGTFF